MRNCIVSAIGKTDVRTLFAHICATRRYVGTPACNAALAPPRVRQPQPRTCIVGAAHLAQR